MTDSEPIRRVRSDSSKRVAVIGAGLAGLVTIKELVDQGHSVVCLEREDDIGGVFRASARSAVYGDMHLTVSNYFMSFSSLPPRESTRRYWTAGEYRDYLHEFAETFELRRHVRFGCDVERIRSASPESWCVTYSQDGASKEEIVDAVAICSGKFREPRIPAFEGIEEFEGRIHHSLEYESPGPFAGKDVVCVGIGESGSDIAHQIAAVARCAHLVVSRPKAIIPRFIFGDTNDAWTSRSFHYSNFVSGSHIEATLKHAIVKFLTRRTRVSAQLVWRLLVKHGFHGEFSNKNDVFFADVDAGRLTLHLFGIERLVADGVILKDGSKIPCSDLVLSTGYDTRFDIVEHPAAREVEASFRNNLFHMIHPRLRESLAWIGYVRPDVGGVPPVTELQARYFAALLSGRASLPPHEHLVRQVERLRADEEFQFHQEPHLTENVRYYHITNQIASRIGARARWYQVILKPRLLLYYYFGSLVACQFRLVGPGRSPEQAERFIAKVGLIKGPLLMKLAFFSLHALGNVVFPLLSGSLRLLGLREADLPRRRRATVRDVLKHEWFKGSARVTDDAALRSLFEQPYEFEGFKYLLATKYGIDPRTLLDPRVTVREVDGQLQRLAGVPPTGADMAGAKPSFDGGTRSSR